MSQEIGICRNCFGTVIQNREGDINCGCDNPDPSDIINPVSIEILKAMQNGINIAEDNLRNLKESKQKFEQEIRDRSCLKTHENANL